MSACLHCGSTYKRTPAPCAPGLPWEAGPDHVCESERLTPSSDIYLRQSFFFSPPAQSFLQHQSGGSLRAEEDAPLVLLPLDWLVVKRSG
jgi:hypothetical protein